MTKYCDEGCEGRTGKPFFVVVVVYAGGHSGAVHWMTPTAGATCGGGVMRGARAAPGDSSGGITLCT